MDRVLSFVLAELLEFQFGSPGSNTDLCSIVSLPTGSTFKPDIFSLALLFGHNTSFVGSPSFSEGKTPCAGRSTLLRCASGGLRHRPSVLMHPGCTTQESSSRRQPQPFAHLREWRIAGLLPWRSAG